MNKTLIISTLIISLLFGIIYSINFIKENLVYKLYGIMMLIFFVLGNIFYHTYEINKLKVEVI